MGIGVSGQEGLQAEQVGRAGAAKQNRTDATFQKPNAPQDEGTHDQFTELCGAHDQRPQPACIKRQCEAPVLTGSRARKRRLVCQLIELASEMTAVKLSNFRFLIQPDPAEHISRAFKDKPGRHASIAYLEDRLSRREPPRLGLRETFDDVKLRFAQLWETLSAAVGG